MREKTRETTKNYINEINEKAQKIVSLEKQLQAEKKDIEKIAAKLRSYKKRGIVKQISKYNYILTEVKQ